jgi:vanillate O-demethylase monooxygenase subunit
MLVGEHLVAFRSQGEVRVFYDRCAHRGAPMSLATPDEGGLRCAYHGWLYSPTGRCREIPALGPQAPIPPRARLEAVGGVQERLGMVFVCLDEPLNGVGLPEVPEDDDPTFARGELAVVRARAGAGLLADNFLDTAHFPFVHAGTFGAGEERLVGRFDVEREPGRLAFSAGYEHSFANREDPGVATGERPLLQTRRLTYRYVAPFHLTLRIDYVEAGGANTIGFFVSPLSEEHCQIFSVLWRNDLGGDPARLDEAVDFEMQVLAEDLRIQEAMHELALPLLGASDADGVGRVEPPGARCLGEVHTRADRTTVELRRVLGDLVALASCGPE